MRSTLSVKSRRKDVFTPNVVLVVERDAYVKFALLANEQLLLVLGILRRFRKLSIYGIETLRSRTPPDTMHCLLS